MVPLMRLRREGYGCVVMSRIPGEHVAVGEGVTVQVKEVRAGAVWLAVFCAAERTVRREAGQIVIDGAMEVALVTTHGRHARLAINAPREVRIALVPAVVSASQPREFRLTAARRGTA